MGDPMDEMIKKFREGTGQQKESDFREIFKFFVSQEGIRGKTKLTPALRNMIYTYDLMHKKHPSWGCDKAAENLAVLLISEEGESRRGMIDLWRGLLSQIRQESVSIDATNNEKK